MKPLLLFLPLLLFACERKGGECGTRANPIQITATHPLGKKLYQDNCASCHRVKGDTITAPPLKLYSDTTGKLRRVFFADKKHFPQSLSNAEFDSVEAYVVSYKEVLVK